MSGGLFILLSVNGQCDTCVVVIVMARIHTRIIYRARTAHFTSANYRICAKLVKIHSDSNWSPFVAINCDVRVRMMLFLLHTVLADERRYLRSSHNCTKHSHKNLLRCHRYLPSHRQQFHFSQTFCYSNVFTATLYTLFDQLIRLNQNQKWIAQGTVVPLVLATKLI